MVADLYYFIHGIVAICVLENNLVGKGTIYNRVQVECMYKSTTPPNFHPKLKKKMQDPRISRPPFFRFNMEIYFVARNEASVRRFNRRFISARSVLRSNQAATVCLRPSYRTVTVSLFYRQHHRTAV